jgi:hypothetical protein
MGSDYQPPELTPDSLKGRTQRMKVGAGQQVHRHTAVDGGAAVAAAGKAAPWCVMKTSTSSRFLYGPASNARTAISALPPPPSRPWPHMLLAHISTLPPAPRIQVLHEDARIYYFEGFLSPGGVVAP